MRRGRRSPTDLRVGDAVDFWRVDALGPDRVLRLRAEMKLPGEAWLEFLADQLSDGRTRLTQTAFFEPRGLLGLLYWYPSFHFTGSSLARWPRGSPLSPKKTRTDRLNRFSARLNRRVNRFEQFLRVAVLFEGAAVGENRHDEA